MREFPDVSAVADTLTKFLLFGNLLLGNPGNLELAILKHLWMINVDDTNVTILTTTCPEDSERMYGVRGNKLDLCDCRNIWIKVS